MLSHLPKQAIPTDSNAQDRRILLFDLLSKGHHSVYLKYLIQYWQQHQVSGTLQIVVAPDFAQSHPDVVALTQTSESDVQWYTIADHEYAHFTEQTSLLAQSFAEWNLFCQYATQLNSTQGLLMYLDSVQIPLIAGKKSPCPISGIYFRPTFHYGGFAEHQSTLSDRIRQWRQKFLLNLLVRKSQFKTLFCLDPFVVPVVQQFKADLAVLPLADPVQLEACDKSMVTALRQSLKIQPQRQVLLMFGELSNRKGIYPALEALQNLSQAQAEQICLVLAGPIVSDERSEITDAIARLAQTSIQLVVCDRYIRGIEVQQYFELADLVLIPYQRHVGMSSVLVHAAAARKPVLASNYGLIGELVRRYQLGLAVDSTSSQMIRQAIEHFLTQSHLCDLDAASQFARRNTHESFAETIFSGLTVTSSLSES
jgi:glycosyltransferase involved in cell wall biosynthesis